MSRDCSAHPWASPFALRATGQPSAVQNGSRPFCHCAGRMPERTSPTATARRVRAGTGPNQPGRVLLHPLSPPDTKKAPFGALRWIVWLPDVGLLGPSMGLTLRAVRYGPAFGCPNSFRTNLSNLRFRSPISLRQIRKKPLSGLFSYLAEREGFEPSIELLTLYTLSRGAPSTTRPSLRVLVLASIGASSPIPGNRLDAKDNRRGLLGKAQDSLTSPGPSAPGSCSRLMRW
jgi:hypothetical protein